MGFPAHERKLLLSTPGLGERIVSRLEAAGYRSIHHISDHGVDHVTRVLCDNVGSAALINRRNALKRALERAGQPAP
jgi:hypothetical protein